jgi:ribosome biogenesis GTPase / thiamine phosphate phosphatase
LPELIGLGWTPGFEEAFQPYASDHQPARITVEHRGAYVVSATDGEQWAEVAGRLRHHAADPSEYPAVGDWVAIRVRPGETTVIDAVLPRRTAFIRAEWDASRVRQSAGARTIGQVLAANVDLVWILGSLTRELSARRVERYLTVAWESGAQPVVVLTKADLAEADPARIAEVERAAVGADVVVTSAVTGEGIDVLLRQLEGNKTAAVLGSSGVGKSTLINRLLGEERLDTQEVRGDEVGRHTTVRRELICLPDGGLVIDTPGLRELVAWEADKGMDTVFADIEELAAGCRFDNCAHRTEPDCAVRAALVSRELEPARFRSYEKMQRERDYLSGRKRSRSKQISKSARQRRKLGIDR